MEDKTYRNQLSLEERVEIISSHTLFSLLTPEDIKELASLMSEIAAPKGTVLVKEGELIENIYLIAKGVAEVTRKPVASGVQQDTLLAKLQKGEGIGLTESGFFSKTGIRTATVTALENMILLSISINEFNHFMQYPGRLYHGLQKSSDMMLKMNLIKHAEPFADLSLEEVHKLVSEIEEISVPAGKFIFHQGEDGDACYLIREGEISIIIEKDPEEVISTLPPLSVFGVGALLTLSQRNASARAQSPCKLLMLRRDLVKNILHRDIFTNEKRDNKKTKNTIEKLFKSNRYPTRLLDILVDENQTPEGKIFTLKNPNYNSYYQLSAEGWFVWNLSDGLHSIQSILDNYQNKFKHKPDENKILNLLSDLSQNHFIHLPNKQRYGFKELISGLFNWIKKPN